MSISILNPDGSTLASQGYVNGTSGFMDTKTLPTAGTYTLVVDPSGANTGSITANLYDVADQTGSIVPGGAAVAVSLPTPGEHKSTPLNSRHSPRSSAILTVRNISPS